ncbi:MAG: Holliday junction branch migration DNA helicase RuvB [Rhabdochlamydiaceae bacterium]|nr:Holliday junction branch migration DNA helicase RuvB [Candidatus Amphrikana amoebophyrae]
MEKTQEHPLSEFSEKDQPYEMQLRPSHLQEFIGHSQVKERLDVFINAAKQRGDHLGHTLLYGPPGLGKTTLANILAKEMGTNLVVTSGPALEKAGDLAGLLTNLQEGDIIFIDEIHALPRNIEEYLYPALEDFTLDLMIDSGANARSIQVSLNPFTLVGATTRAGLLSSPLRSRFNFVARLDYYTPKELDEILIRSAKILKLNIERDATNEISNRSRGTPRIANNLLKWVRDYVQIKSNGVANKIAVKKALDMLAIDHQGLDEMDKKILNVIIQQYSGGPVGIKTLAAAIGEEMQTIEEVYEPFLMMKGFIKRTMRGREATKNAYRHLGIEHGSE